MHLTRQNYDFQVPDELPGASTYSAMKCGHGRMLETILLFALLLTVGSGCASSQKASARLPGRQATTESVSALSAIAQTYTKSEMDEEKLRAVAKDIQSDPEARSAVEAITQAMEGGGSIKYSPATGKRYSGDLDVDPETGVKLLPLEP